MNQESLQYVVGVDLGGTKIELGVVDAAGRMHHHLRLETRVEEGPQVIENQILVSIQSLQKQIGVPILGVGVGAAGQIHAQTGEVIFAPNLKWHHVPLQFNLEQALKIPVRIINDVRAITWGEWQYGAGKGYDDLLCVFVGTGIGGGIVSGGRLLIGCSNTFGEIGHMTIDFKGPICTCGKRGCLEAFAGGWGIAARAQEAIEADGRGDASQLLLKKVNGELNAMTARTVVQAYHEGDEMAKRIIEQAKQALIAGIASLVNAFNPCRLILGGGVIEGLPEFVQAINEEVRRIALKAATQSLTIVPARLGKEVGIIGSAAAIFSLLKQEREGL
jgi:glucokinase